MAKNKSSEIPHYEMLYIISNKYTEEETKTIANKIKKIIEKEEGKITYEEEWGKRKLAYPIKHFNYGYYNLVEFDLDTSKINDLNNTMRIMKEILRHVIVKRPKRTLEEINKEKEKREKTIKSLNENQEEIKKKEEKNSKKIKKDNKKKIDLKQLDKKLDELLEVDDLL